MKTAALYARVSSEKQTIGSQTEALKEYAQTNGYTVLPGWIFRDEGYSGAILRRPDLERLRDLAAEGQIETILVYSPDRLSRKYAYQVLLMEEFARQGVETVFVKSPPATTPEEQLLVQFQGMIAEYERAQIAERTRRGKRYPARNGSINVLCGAPYGYRYVKKSETSAAYYDVIEEEAGNGAGCVSVVHRGSVEHRGDHAETEHPGRRDPAGKIPMGEVDRVGHAPQSRL